MIKPYQYILPLALGTLFACSTPMPGSSSSSGASDRSNTAKTSSGKSDASSASSAQASGATVTPVPLVVLVPIEVRADPKLFNGCWVRLLDNVAKPKGDDELTIVGRMNLPTMKTASGVDWKRKADGLIIGQNAVVTAYGEEWYKGAAVLLKPGQVIQDLRKELGFVNSIESLKIECRA